MRRDAEEVTGPVGGPASKGCSPPAAHEACRAPGGSLALRRPVRGAPRPQEGTARSRKTRAGMTRLRRKACTCSRQIRNSLSWSKLRVPWEQQDATLNCRGTGDTEARGRVPAPRPARMSPRTRPRPAPSTEEPADASPPRTQHGRQRESLRTLRGTAQLRGHCPLFCICMFLKSMP